MDIEQKQYNISEKEIVRRKNAFTSLMSSLLVGSIIFSINFVLANIQIAIIIFASLGVIFLIFWLMTYKYLDNLLKLKVLLTGAYILRVWNKTEGKIYIDEIKRVNIKKTAKGYNRAIKIVSEHKNVMIINGLEDFDQFEQELLKRVDKGKIRQVKEPLDFDHPLFYPFFGLLVSFLFINGFKVLTGLDAQGIKIFVISILILNFIVSIYFIIAKPLSKALEVKRLNPDYFFSISVILIDIAIYLLYY